MQIWSKAEVRIEMWRWQVPGKSHGWRGKDETTQGRRFKMQLEAHGLSHVQRREAPGTRAIDTWEKVGG